MLTRLVEITVRNGGLVNSSDQDDPVVGSGSEKRGPGDPLGGVRKRPLATLAHELKTPISAIAAAADVMRHEQLGPLGNDKYLSYADDIHASALLVLAVIDRLMAARSGDEAGARIAPVVIDVRQLLSNLCSAMQPLAQAGGIALRVGALESERDNPIEIMADEVAVNQILLNLVNNALKFTSIGGRVALCAKVLGDRSVVILVVDTGSGMTHEQIEMALSGQPVALDGGMQPARGLGIGLPLVRALCEANGARLELSSEGPKSGTTAQITFESDRRRGVKRGND